ncbi:CHAT domain-containing protein [Microcoleus sp. FACHB-1515]|uniref:CHAT domain-containing protein n=1 Tax=Cyanophyceae TaxID=3028117 RepID=UPI001684FB0A|nr:CHAT domain-containing protein [Microcoleus sp. FACHB-1515]MBD2091274.1 CHAT domain-containing protein [Microcoleus sp. FACHB-1515]
MRLRLPLLNWFAATLLMSIALPVALPLAAETAMAEQSDQIPQAAQAAELAEADRLLNLGIVQQHNQQFELALQSTQQALEIYERLNIPQAIAQAKGNLGIIYTLLGNATQAEIFLQQSLDLARELRDPQTEGNALGALGQLYLLQRDYPRAISSLQQALDIARLLDNQPMLNAAQELLQEAQEAQESDAAIEDFMTGLATEIQQNPADAIAQLFECPTVSLLTPQDSIETAAQLFETSTTANSEADRNCLMLNLNLRGIALMISGNYAEAIQVLEQYQRLAEQGSPTDPLSQSIGLLNLAQAYWGNGDLRQAEVKLRDMMRIWETWGGWNSSGLQTDDGNLANSEIARQTLVYEMLQSVLMAQNQPEAALEISERARSIALTNLLTQRVQTTERFAIATPTADELRSIAKAQQATIVEYSTIKYQDENSRLLYIWVIQPTGEIHAQAINLSTLDRPLSELVASSRDAIGARGRSATVSARPTADAIARQQAQQRQDLQQLHQLLIEPIARYLPTNQNDRVIFIPQGELFLVPFPALMNAQGRYLIQDHTILTAPSIQVLDLTRQMQPRRDRDAVLVVGNPVMPDVWNPETAEREQLSSLPGAETEAEAIAHLFRTEPLLWNQATETEVKRQMQTAAIVHLATHGLLEYGDPQESGVLDAPGAIALSPSAQDDGLLTSAELYSMNLTADLVVLSACDTGRGRITGDGVVGLSRSLMRAGVPSILVSLWKVPDAPTAELMIEFYQNLQTQPDQAQALRQAMLSVMQQHPDPLNWAAFTLIGQAE